MLPSDFDEGAVPPLIKVTGNKIDASKDPQAAIKAEIKDADLGKFQWHYVTSHNNSPIAISKLVKRHPQWQSHSLLTQYNTG